MKINRQAIVNALKAVQPGISGNENIKQSNCFIFDKDRVFSYNNEIAVSYPIKVGFTGAIPAKEFQALINKIKTDEIDLTINEGELRIKGSKAKAGLRLDPEITLPLEELGMPTEWITLPDTFCKAVKFCLFSASKDPNKAILMNLHIINQFVESSDNFRVTQYDMGKEALKAFPEEFLIPATAAKDIVLNAPIEYALTQGWIHFANEADVVFSCRYDNSEYPDFTEWLDCDGGTIEFPEEINHLLDCADVLSDDERIGIFVEDGNLTIYTENESGWYESEPVACGYEGNSLEFDIQPDFMKVILKFDGTAIIGDHILKFESDNFVHGVQLMSPRVKK